MSVDVRAMQVTTPHQYMRRKKLLSARRAEIRAAIGQIRCGRNSLRYLVREEAEGIAAEVYSILWPSYRAIQQWLVTHRPEKYSAMSPAAAMRATGAHP